MKPWQVEIFGAGVFCGRLLNRLCHPDRKVRFTVWPVWEGSGKIEIGSVLPDIVQAQE